MDDPLTQPATQKQIPYRQMLSKTDQADVLCILHPSSPAAYDAVRLVASSTPQHILQNEGLSEILDYMQQPSPILPRDKKTKDSEDVDDADHFDSTTQQAAGVDALLETRPSLSIALRISSRLTNPSLGFCFGRNSEKCDLLISSVEEQMKISNMHFRIFLTKHGTIMLEDTSTNGTIVDGVPLRHKINAKTPHVKYAAQRLISDGSTIELMVFNPKETMRFIVSAPDREGQSKKWERKLSAYIEYIEQLKRQDKAYQDAVAEGMPPMMPPRPMLQPNQMLQGGTRSPIVSHNLAAATEPYRYGMSWNGGDKYKVTGSLGKGAFACVYKVVRKDNGEAFAAKELEKRRFMKDNMVGSKIHTELSIMKKLHHPNIVGYVDQYEDETHLVIIMELVPYGDLRPYVEGNQTPMIEYNGKSVALQICQALEYLHKSKITHRDIKPDNILIQSEDPLYVKLSDFGLSKVVNDEETFLKSFCGTLLYCAPEVYPEFDQEFNNQKRLRPRHGTRRPKQPYTTAVDVWGLAAVLYHLLCGRPPFPAQMGTSGHSMLTQILTHSVDYGKLKHAGVTNEGIDFLSRMLVVDPRLRMTDAACLAHPWFKEKSTSQDGPLVDSREQVPFSVAAQGSLRVFETEPDDVPDASQLSLYDRRGDDNTDNDEDFMAKVVGINTNYSHKAKRSMPSNEAYPNQSARGSKRVRGADGSTGSHLGESQHSSADVNYPSLSEFYQDPVPAPNHAAAGNRLFGEISQSALQSSGALGWNAQAALNMLPEEGGSRDLSASSDYDGSRYFTTDVGHQQQLQVQQPMPTRAPAFGSSAPSLLGAEALVGRLHMNSTVSVATRPTTPKTREETPQHGSGSLSGANATAAAAAAAASQDSDGLYSASPQEPSGKKVDDVKSHRGVKDLNTQQQYNAPNPATVGPAEASISHRKPSASQSHKQEAVQSAAAPAEAQNRESSQLSKSSLTPAPLSQSIDSQSSQNSKLSTHLPPPSTTTPLRSAKPLGLLTTTTSSLLTQKLTLTSRITTYGRSPSDTFTYPQNLDSRCPKNAFEITFWQPGLERRLAKNPGIEIGKLRDLEALITSRSSTGVVVYDGLGAEKDEARGEGGSEGVRVRKGEGEWVFGRLRTGDIICVFGAEEESEPKSGKGKRKGSKASEKGETETMEGAAVKEKNKEKEKECLKFRVEIFVGKGKEKRKEGERFAIEKEVEKWRAEQLRRSQSGSVGDGSGGRRSDSRETEVEETAAVAAAAAKESGKDVQKKEMEKQKQKKNNRDLSVPRSEAAWSTVVEVGGDGDTQMGGTAPPDTTTRRTTPATEIEGEEKSQGR